MKWLVDIAVEVDEIREGEGICPSVLADDAKGLAEARDGSRDVYVLDARINVGHVRRIVGKINKMPIRHLLQAICFDIVRPARAFDRIYDARERTDLREVLEMLVRDSSDVIIDVEERD